MKIGFLSILTLIFITLKLCGVIAWSWWLVLLPLYAGLALVLGFMAIAWLLSVVLIAIGELFEGRKTNKTKKFR